jgi:hypothetical protein
MVPTPFQETFRKEKGNGPEINPGPLPAKTKRLRERERERENPP